jgi:hypothetical protein
MKANKPSLPVETEIIDVPYGTVIFSVENNRPPKLYVQIIDAYGYQRELIVQVGYPGENANYHAYQHYGRRYTSQVSNAAAKAFIARFLQQTKEYPSLLFNECVPKYGDVITEPIKFIRPACVGFVLLSDRLLNGYPLTQQMLDSA